MIDINLTGAFDLSHAVARYMIPQKSGCIINICSLFSFLGGLGSSAYAAMKAGLAGLTKAYADELGKYGITVNGIAPGYFQTAMTAGTGSGNEEDPKDMTKRLSFKDQRRNGVVEFLYLHAYKNKKK